MEIERRFLVDPDFRPGHPVRIEEIRQAYLPGTGDWTIRARTVHQDGAMRRVVTLKRARGWAVSDEIEFDVPAEQHDAMIALCGPAVIKTRYVVAHGGREWEVDVFRREDSEPPAIAEVELPSVDAALEMPAWAGAEVTGDPWYSNAAIAARIMETSE